MNEQVFHYISSFMQMYDARAQNKKPVIYVN